MAASVLLLALMLTAATVPLRPTPAMASQSPSPAPAPAHSPQNDTEFIRQSCDSTLYPSLCYSSLAGYAGAVDQDPTQLAVVAANVTLASVRAVYSYVSALRRSVAARAVDERTAAALRDCVESLDNAADLTLKAAAELGMLPAAEGMEVAWRVSNAQTWISAAMTYEGTCRDGFEGATPAEEGEAGGSGAAVKNEVCGRVEVAQQYTSNALALVNGLVARRKL